MLTLEEASQTSLMYDHLSSGTFNIVVIILKLTQLYLWKKSS